jgi:hypothetical protein
MILPILFIVLASISKSIQDKISFHWDTSIFSKINDGNKLYNWLNPSISWQNKWKDRYKPHGEKFWGSSRWFVFIIDGWHLLDTLRTLFSISILTSFSGYTPFFGYLVEYNILARCLDTLTLLTIFSSVFELLFTLFSKLNR